MSQALHPMTTNTLCTNESSASSWQPYFHVGNVYVGLYLHLVIAPRFHANESYLLQNMKKRHFLFIFNETKPLCVRADSSKPIKLRNDEKINPPVSEIKINENIFHDPNSISSSAKRLRRYCRLTTISADAEMRASLVKSTERIYFEDEISS